MPALIALVATSSLLASSAAAFTLQNNGFSATTYSSAYPLDPTGHGARASAWTGNVLWAVDGADGGLYRADAGALPTAATALSPTRVAVIAGGVNGLAAGANGRLYLTLVDVQQVVEYDPATAGTRVIASGSLGPRSIATDPLTGDLIVTGAGRVWRITNPGGASPVTSIYTTLPGNAGSRAIAIGPDGTIFVVNDYDQLFTIESTAAAATHTGSANASPMGSPVAGISGLAVVTNGIDGVPQFLMASTTAGAVYKTPATSGASGNTILVLDAAGAGDQLSVGPDRCAYASMDGAVLRVADATGACALDLAGVTPPALTISDTTGQPARAGGTASLGAHLTNASTLSGHVITFRVSGTPALTLSATTDSSGNASVSYSRPLAGTDTVTATTSADGFAVTSNTITIAWQPAPDFAAPLIAFSYSVPAGGTGTTFACDTTKTSASFPSGTQPRVGCGWFTRAPTIHFTVTPTGTSGLGTLSNCADYTLDTQPPAAGQPQTCRAYNGDGLASSTLTVMINAVLTPPSVVATATANAAPYAAGGLTRWPVTVHFDCSASPIQMGLTCPPDQTFSGTGAYEASDVATDIAGQSTTTHFGPIHIDATPPTIAVTPVGYTYGAWSNGDVHLLFTCADNVGIASCPGDVMVAVTTAGYTATATDSAGNVASATSGPINIDRTPPVITVIATTADGAPYTAATPTNQNVIVHFLCVTDGAPIPVCGPDVTVATEGAFTATGHAIDAAGNSASALYAVVIDRTAPTIDVIVTVNGAPYDGSWTQGPVLVHFACADDRQLASCPADQTLVTDRDAAVSGTARDAAGNTSVATTAAIRIDRTPPVSTATPTGVAVGAGTYLRSVTFALVATDGGSGVAGLTYVLDGVAHSDAASVSVLVDTPGSHTLVFRAIDAAGNVEADHTVTFAVIFRERTTLTITSAPFLATGSAVTARLYDLDAATPVAGETVAFAAGSVTRAAVTDAAGVARIDLGLTPGAYLLTATYAGTARYFPSEDRQQLVAFVMTRFVVWGPNATFGAVVQFYGDGWAKQIANKEQRKRFDDFKGYAQIVFDAYWTGRPGDTVKPARTLPEYIGVILTTQATTTKDTITGDVAGIAVLKVASHDDDHDRAVRSEGRLGERGLGTVVGLQTP